jgi:dCMP deaminase
MEIANVASRRASCPRLQVGAVLIRNNHIVTTGYNGSPHGFPHCTDEGCDIFKAEYSPDDVREHCQRTVHAEMNVIIEAAKIGVSTEGTCMYITAFPCWVCARHIIQANITTIIYKPHPKYGPDSKTLTAFKSAGIEVLDYTTLVNQ